MHKNSLVWGQNSFFLPWAWFFDKSFPLIALSVYTRFYYRVAYWWFLSNSGHSLFFVLGSATRLFQLLYFMYSLLYVLPAPFCCDIVFFWPWVMDYYCTVVIFDTMIEKSQLTRKYFICASLKFHGILNVEVCRIPEKSWMVFT